ncbi:MAG: double-strand break repair protein AddB [Pseudomonadota bacterium]
MFEPQDGPRIFGLAPGIDFPKALTSGLIARMQNAPPEAMARVVIYVNTARMQRRIRQLLSDAGPALLPQIKMITALHSDPSLGLDRPADGLARRLDLAQLTRKLIESDQDLAASDAAFDLADSLAALLEEMQSEGVTMEQITALDVAGHSAHWDRSKQFIALVQRYLGPDAAPDTEAQQRRAVELLSQSWAANPPDHPILVAGSTGSRGTTRAFMRAVSRLPQGAVLLPGFDRDMPEAVWQRLRGDHAHGAPHHDHPQYRYFNLMEELGLPPADILHWSAETPLHPARNRLATLALRPAPVTDAWLDEGPNLSQLDIATKDITLIEAPSPGLEVMSIALRLRKAAEDGQKAALIATDQTLARRVKAALSVWGMTPDDSAGDRLDLSPPGRLLRLTADMIGQSVAPARLLALLKHPLTCAPDRSAHLPRTRDLEMQILRGAGPEIPRADALTWAENREATDPGTQAWMAWLWGCVDTLTTCQSNDLLALAELHAAITLSLTKGPHSGDAPLWEKDAGEAALKLMSKLQEAAPAAGPHSASDYARLVAKLMAREEVREPFLSRPDIMVWGTLEARVQGADLVILAGLNEGSWPQLPDPDPWLNRQMRVDAGLRLPDARIGLSAHDFQQAFAAREVWLTRAMRDAEAETVPSRWLNRLSNLMQGLPGEGQAAYKAMRERGQYWLKQARAYDTPRIKLDQATRPSPQPPVAARPKDLWVTHIETLIRDPYAVYARHILGLKPLKPLEQQADAALRGDVIHKILQAFIAEYPDTFPEAAADRLKTRAKEFFERHISWPATRALWVAKFARAIPWFIQTERARRALALPAAYEADGKRAAERVDFTLHGRADRIDRDADGALVLYDYKTGQLPTPNIQKHFNKQLPLLGAIAAAAGFEGFKTGQVKQVSYIGLGANPAEIPFETDPYELEEVWQKFEALISEYMDAEKGYTSRRAVYEERWSQDYDLLARWGEWDRTDAARPQKVGP